MNTSLKSAFWYIKKDAAFEELRKELIEVHDVAAKKQIQVETLITEKDLLAKEVIICCFFVWFFYIFSPLYLSIYLFIFWTAPWSYVEEINSFNFIYVYKLGIECTFYFLIDGCLGDH